MSVTPLSTEIPTYARCLHCGRIRDLSVLDCFRFVSMSPEEEVAVTLAGKMHTCYCNSGDCFEIVRAGGGLKQRLRAIWSTWWMRRRK